MAVAALAGLLATPLAILIAIASFFITFANFPDVRAALYGATAAAAGLALGTAAKMAIKIPFDAKILLLTGAAFAASALARLPLSPLA